MSLGAIVFFSIAVNAAAVVIRHTSAGSATARNALVRRADLGRGWSVGAAAPSRAPSLTCPAFSPSVGGATEVGRDGSPTFQRTANGPFVSETAYAYGSSGQEANVWAAVARRALLRCFAAALVNGSGSGVRFTVKHKRTFGVAGLGTRAAGYRVSGTASLTAQTVPVYLDTIVLGAGRLIAALGISTFSAPVAPGLETGLVRAAARRLSSA